MLRKLLVTTFAITLFTIFLGSESNAQTRVYFKKGSSTGAIASTVKGKSRRTFVLGAKKGQMIYASVTSTKDRVLFDGEAGTRTLKFQAVNGDNYVNIYNTSSYRTRFRVVFTIKNVAQNSPIRVNFAKGKESKTINLQMNHNKMKKKYVVRARKGQQLTVKMLSQNVKERVGFWIEDKSRVENIMAYKGHYYCVVKETGDYVIDVSKFDDRYLSGRMQIIVDEFAQ